MLNLNGQGRNTFRRQNQQVPMAEGAEEDFYLRMSSDEETGTIEENTEGGSGLASLEELAVFFKNPR